MFLNILPLPNITPTAISITFLLIVQLSLTIKYEGQSSFNSGERLEQLPQTLNNNMHQFYKFKLLILRLLSWNNVYLSNFAAKHTPTEGYNILQHLSKDHRLN